jgi:hypothetical protein
LKKNSDVFAWTHQDMPGIDLEVMIHVLSVDPKPMKQKKRNKAIVDEV